MKLTKKILALSIAGLGFSSNISAQDFFGEMIKGGVNDGRVLLRNYISPYTKGFGSGLNAGWYNTAQTHSLLRPDLTLSFNSVFVPKVDKTFDVSSVGLTTMEPVDLTKTITPTVAGESNDGPEMKVISTIGGIPYEAGRFKMPPGTGVGFIPVPTAQFGIGLPLKTDVMVRWIPTINLSNVGKIGLFGFGIKHDFKQWIPGISALPFDMSFLFGYTQLKSQFDLNVDPDPNAQQTGASYEDQNLTLEVSSYTFGLLASKKISVLTVYGGLAYDVSSTSINLNGNYPVNSVDPLSLSPQIMDVKDPIQNEVIDGANSPKLTLGARLKFAVFTMHADYSFAKYSTLSLGIGFSMGN